MRADLRREGITARADLRDQALSEVEASARVGAASGAAVDSAGIASATADAAAAQAAADAAAASAATKEPAIAAGTTAQYWRGDKSWQALNGLAVANTPAGGIAAVTVQAAINELDTEKLNSASYTATDVLAKLLTVDGSGSGLDADLLDGISSAAFGQLAIANSWSAVQTIAVNGAPFVLNSLLSNALKITFQNAGAAVGYAGANATGPILADSAAATRLQVSTGGIAVTGASTATTWLKSGSYTVATVPSAATAGAGAQIYVSNEAGGAVTAFSDATNWRRSTDRAIIS